MAKKTTTVNVAVTADARKFRKEFDKAGKDVGKFSANAKKAMKGFALAGIGAAVGIGAAIDRADGNAFVGGRLASFAEVYRTLSERFIAGDEDALEITARFTPLQFLGGLVDGHATVLGRSTNLQLE